MKFALRCMNNVKVHHIDIKLAKYSFSNTKLLSGKIVFVVAHNCFCACLIYLVRRTNFT